jgi:hypothetical protein
MNQPSIVPSVMASPSLTTEPSSRALSHWSCTVLVHSSGAMAGEPRMTIELVVGTVSPVTISTSQPKPACRMVA